AADQHRARAALALAAALLRSGEPAVLAQHVEQALHRRDAHAVASPVDGDLERDGSRAGLAHPAATLLRAARRARGEAAPLSASAASAARAAIARIRRSGETGISSTRAPVAWA